MHAWFKKLLKASSNSYKTQAKILLQLYNISGMGTIYVAQENHNGFNILSQNTIPNVIIQSPVDFPKSDHTL